MMYTRFIQLALFSLIVSLFHFHTLKAQDTPNGEKRSAISKEHSLSNGAEIPAQTEENGNRFFSELLNMLFALGLIIGLMILVSWALKRLLNTRMKQMNTTSSVKILERRTLSPKAGIYLLDVCGKGVVIAESPAGIVHLGNVELPPEDEMIASNAPENSSFGKILKRKMENENSPQK